MGHFILAMLLPLLFQASAPPPAMPSPTAPARVGEQSATEAAPAVPTPPRPRSQDEIDELVEQRIREALGGLTSDGDREMSPETEKAIETAVEKFLADPEIKSSIAHTISQANPIAMRGMLTGIIISLSFFGLIGLIAALLYQRGQARLRARTEFHQQVLSKFTSAQEFAQFLNTPGSQQLLEGMWGGSVNPKERLLKHVRLGAIFTILGIGCLILSFFEGDGYVFGVAFLGLGIGFLVSARVTYQLSEKLGLMGDGSSGSSAEKGS